MGAWRCDIYSNDTAQDFLGTLYKMSKEEEWFHLFLEKAKANHLYEYEEAKYVLADLELDLTGRVSNEEEVVKLIKKELDSIEDYGDDAEERENELLKLLEKIKNKEESDFENLDEWLEEKRKNDIF